jgi:hypothetical protein
MSQIGVWAVIWLRLSKWDYSTSSGALIRGRTFRLFRLSKTTSSTSHIRWGCSWSFHLLYNVIVLIKIVVVVHHQHILMTCWLIVIRTLMMEWSLHKRMLLNGLRFLLQIFNSLLISYFRLSLYLALKKHPAFFISI